jgi:cell division initiation protein
MAKITIVDIQHKEFKRSLQGYDRNDVNEFLDEIIETLEDEAQTRAALQGEAADLRERISHFKSMEESLQSTLLLAQRTADEVKAAAHKEADLIKQEARLAGERELASLGDRIDESRREAQRHQDTAEKAKSELRSLLMSHLSLIDRAPVVAVADGLSSAPVANEAPAKETPPATGAVAAKGASAAKEAPAGKAAPAGRAAPAREARTTKDADTDEMELLAHNGAPTHLIVE